MNATDNHGIERRDFLRLSAARVLSLPHRGKVSLSSIRRESLPPTARADRW